MENLAPPPPPPPNQGWENGAFLPSSGARLHPWFEGDGGLLFHFIFSKIVACSRIWDWVESAESRKREHENKTGRNFSPHGRLFACLSLSRFPTIVEPGTGQDPRVASQKNNVTIEIWRKIQLRHSSPYLLRKLSGPQVQSKSIVDFGPQRQLYFYNLHSGPAIRTDAGLAKPIKTTN